MRAVRLFLVWFPAPGNAVMRLGLAALPSRLRCVARLAVQEDCRLVPTPQRRRLTMSVMLSFTKVVLVEVLLPVIHLARMLVGARLGRGVRAAVEEERPVHRVAAAEEGGNTGGAGGIGADSVGNVAGNGGTAGDGTLGGIGSGLQLTPGQAGLNGSGGAGGGYSNSKGGAGGAGVDSSWDATHGPGGGGGGGSSGATNYADGGAGGLYGGAGGGGGYSQGAGGTGRRGSLLSSMQVTVW